jgi:hypothetical protein
VRDAGSHVRGRIDLDGDKLELDVEHEALRDWASADEIESVLVESERDLHGGRLSPVTLLAARDREGVPRATKRTQYVQLRRCVSRPCCRASPSWRSLRRAQSSTDRGGTSPHPTSAVRDQPSQQVYGFAYGWKCPLSAPASSRRVGAGRREPCFIVW